MNSQVNYLPIVINPYNGLSDKKLAPLLKSISIKLNGNDKFAPLAEQIAAFGKAQNAYGTLVAKAKNRDVDTVAAKNTARAAVIALATDLGIAMQAFCGSDLELLINSGIPLRKAAKTKTATAPSRVVVTAGNAEGELNIKCSGAWGNKSFIYKYRLSTDTESSNWQTMNCGLSTCVISGLISGQKYYVQVGIVGAKGKNYFTDAVLSPFVP